MAVGTRVFFDMMYRRPDIALVLGDLCSRVTVPVAESARWWNIVQVCRVLSLSDCRYSLNPLSQTRID